MLVPVSAVRHRSFFCLDYRHDPVNPPVIWFEYEEAEPWAEYPGTNLYWVQYVAPSFSDMLRQTVPYVELEETPRVEGIDPYRFPAELADWRSGLETYLSQYNNVDFST